MTAALTRAYSRYEHPEQWLLLALIRALYGQIYLYIMPGTVDRNEQLYLALVRAYATFSMLDR